MAKSLKQMIRDIYYCSPDLTIYELSQMTGLTVAQLNKILMEN